MRATMALILLFAAFATQADPSVETPDVRWDVAQLMQSLAQVRSAKGRFVEKKYLRILNTPLEATGTLSYQAPGHLEKQTRVPREESMILDGGSLVIENKVRGKRSLALHDYPLLWAFIESIRSTLAGDLTTLSKFYQVKLDGDARHWRLTLLPSDAKTLEVVREIRIGGREERVDEIEILETSGDRSVMTVIEDRRETP